MQPENRHRRFRNLWTVPGAAHGAGRARGEAGAGAAGLGHGVHGVYAVGVPCTSGALRAACFSCTWPPQSRRLLLHRAPVPASCAPAAILPTPSLLCPPCARQVIATSRSPYHDIAASMSAYQRGGAPVGCLRGCCCSTAGFQVQLQPVAHNATQPAQHKSHNHRPPPFLPPPLPPDVKYFTDANDFCEEHPEVVILASSILSLEAVRAAPPPSPHHPPPARKAPFAVARLRRPPPA